MVSAAEDFKPLREETYRNFPGLMLAVIGTAALFAYGFYLVVRNPEVMSPRGIAFGLGFVIMEVFLCSALVALWRTAWRFTLTPTRFIAVNRLRRRRINVPWSSVAQVRKVPRSWWNRRGGVGFSEIETTNRERIRFGTHMFHYQSFLQELEARAINCRSFEAYRSHWDR